MSVVSLALRAFRIPRPTEPVKGWHVAPAVDVLAYQFSWLFILVPLALAGESHPTDYLALWAVGITTSFVHRHVTMPYVYLDGDVFRAHKPRFTMVPLILLAGFFGSVLLQQARAPAGFFVPMDIALFLAGMVVFVQLWWRDRQGEVLSNVALSAGTAPFAVALLAGIPLLPEHHQVFLVVVGGVTFVSAVVVGGSRRWLLAVALLLVVGVVATITIGPLNSSRYATRGLVGAFAMAAALWNIWHTAAQKVGILRVYNAKSEAPVDKKVPLWVDRALVFGWFPFLAAFLVVEQRATILKQGRVVKMYLEPVLDGVSAVAPELLPIGVLCIVGSLGNFLWHEWKATRLRSTPRLTMALGLTLLSASFLVASPLKVYVAYGFSHAIEYVVFVWAFQRRRYAVPLSPQPLLQKILKHSVLFYSLFIGLIAGIYFYSEFGRQMGFYEKPIRLMGLRTGTIIYVWAIWHSFAHFYFDGFLWKMRLKSVRASL